LNKTSLTGERLREVLRLGSKYLQLPNYLPVIFPVETSYHVERKIRSLIPQIAKGVVINSYNLLRQSRPLQIECMRLLKDCFVFIDSGGFLITNLETYNDTIKVYFDKFCTSIQEILKLQNSFAEIGNNVDFLSTHKSIKSEKHYVNHVIKINSCFIDLYLSAGKEFLFFPTVHAHHPIILRTLCEKLIKHEGEYHGISVGGLVLLKNDVVKILTRLLYVKSVFPDVPIHAFGVGNPILLPIMFSMGISSVDSTSYLKYGLESKYIHPTSLKILDINHMEEKLPCSCNVCQTYRKSSIMSMGSMGKAFISLHNLNTYIQLSDFVREDSEKLLRRLSDENPLIAKVAKILAQIERTSKFNSLNL